MLGLGEEVGAIGAERVGGKGFKLGDKSLVSGFLGSKFCGVLGDEGR